MRSKLGSPTSLHISGPSVMGPLTLGWQERSRERDGRCASRCLLLTHIPSSQARLAARELGIRRAPHI